VPAGFLVLHHAVPSAPGIDVVARLRREIGLAGGQEAWRKTLTDQAGLAEAPDRRKTEPDEWCAIVTNVRHNGDRRCVETARRYAGISIA
jgi:hypothetical protein